MNAVSNAAYPGAFVAVIELVLGHEGGLTTIASDPGNWTGGVVGRGLLRGTKWGISAASFPTLDIIALTRDQAVAIYYSLYWQKTACALVPVPLALLVMDAAVNNGIGRAVRWLQVAAGDKPDGLFGTESLRALTAALAADGGLDSVRAEFQAQRMMFMTALSDWSRFGLGWARRLCKLPLQSALLQQAASTPG